MPAELTTLFDSLAAEIANAVVNESGMGLAYNLDYLQSSRGIVAIFGFGGSNEFVIDDNGREHLKPESARDFVEEIGFFPNETNLALLKQTATAKLVKDGILVDSPDGKILLTAAAEQNQQASKRRYEEALDQMRRYSSR